MSYKKDGLLVFHHLLSSFVEKDAGALLQGVQFLGPWLMEQPHENKGEGAYFFLITEVEKLRNKFDGGAQLELADFETLIPPLEALSREWLPDVHMRLYLDRGCPRPDKLPISVGVRFVLVNENSDNVELIDGDSIHVLYSDGSSDLCRDGSRIDMYIVGEDLERATAHCIKFIEGDYDRSHLRGKLEGLARERNDTRLIALGQLQAAAGILEGRLPLPAQNLAVSHGDPFYAMRAALEAKKRCRTLDTIVIAAPYYFWHLDIREQPDSFERAFAPVLGRPGGSARGTGEHPPYLASHALPLLECMFDLRSVMDSHSRNVSREVPGEDFYNQRHPRPALGKLEYRFTRRSDDENRADAELFASRIAGYSNEAKLADNIAQFSDFLDKMQKRGVRVLAAIPPATRLLRESSPDPSRVPTVRALEALSGKGLEFYDFYDDADFTGDDFADYETLNEQGAIKFTKKLAAMLG